MAIKEFTPNRTIDLTMEEGNVFSLIGIATRLAKELEKDGKAISKEMMSSDYGNAVYLFDREFGEFFDIILPKCMTMKGVKNSYMKTNNNEENMKEVYLK